MSDNAKVSVRYAPSSQRRHHRLTAPLDVIVDGNAWAAQDWSVGGLRFRPDRTVAFIPGDTMPITLSLPFHDFNVSVEVQSRVVRADAESGDVAFQFVDLPARAKELLHYFSENLLRGEMAPIDGTIKRLDLPVTPPRPEAPKAPIVGTGVRHDARPWLVGSTYVTIGVILAAGLLFALYKTLFIVPSEQALIFTPTADLIVPEDGTVSAVYVREGDLVAAGDRLLEIASPRVEQMLSDAHIKEREARIAIQRLTQLIVSEQHTLTPYRDITSDQLVAAEARLASAEKLAGLLERQHARVTPLLEEGFITLQDFDKVETEMQRAREAVIEAQAGLRIAHAAQDSAQNGRYYTSNRLEGRLPELQAELTSAKEQVGVAKMRLQELERQAERLVLRAPMSGRVRQVPVVAGGAVSGGMLAVSLQTDDRPRVYALVPSEQLARIAIGHRATVYVPALSRELDANVVSVEPRIWSLPENVRRLFGNPSDGGLVVLSFLPDEQEVATLHPGLPVTVEMGSEGSRHGVQSVSNMLGVSKSQAATVPVHAVK